MPRTRTTTVMASPVPPRRALPGLVLALALLGTLGCQRLMPAAPAAPDVEPPPAAPAEVEPETPEQSAPPAPAAPEPRRQPLTRAEHDQVAQLLYRAEQAIEADHLTYPAQGSALALYDRVRILDPDNDEARRGLERIVERYLELALAAADRRRFSAARAMLDRARLVDPHHPNVDPTRWQIDLLARADRQVIPLDGERLRHQDPGLSQTLRQAGLASRGDGCRAQITARSDSEGRWIYQQMSQAPGDHRIRAELDIGTPPRIEVLCFSE